MQFPNINPIIPEIILTILGLLILLFDVLIKKKEVIIIFSIFFIGAAFYSLPFSFGSTFNGMYSADSYSVFFKFTFLVILSLSILISIRYLKLENNFHGEYYALLVFATVGMMVMASARNLVLFYIGLELMALSTYILAGFLRRDIRSTEAAVKYYLLGAFSSAILLYGISLTYGMTGSMDLANIETYIINNGLFSNKILLIAIVFFISALGFKVAAAPFHMWTPDVYEGAPTSVTAFMSVGPKAAAFAFFGRLFLLAFPLIKADWALLLIPVSVLTMAVGNILAISQSNIKRMLAYSSIAHAGYVLLGIIAGTNEGLSSMMTYLLIYVFMNIGAFSVVIMMKTEDSLGDKINDYRGLSHSHPVLALFMLIFMFALAGIPPTAGFIGKFYIFKALIDSGFVWVSVVALVFSVISAFFYLRIVVLMYMKEPENDAKITFSLTNGVVLLISVAAVIYIGLYPELFIEYAKLTLL
ncbi:proton-translocating NADH-quinone oxidoreductase subunit N [Candidatus Magnetoovum chiemensis]|nr:proton-translocating NADH-quinone oxidoreductase subunit N [Candidatus Magnetoovum chiemensis]